MKMMFGGVFLLDSSASTGAKAPKIWKPIRTHVNRILNSLFEESGAEIYIRPAGHYIPDGAHLSFFDVAAACRARDEPETLVGFRRTGDDRAVVNPPDKSTKRVWDYYDMLVVLAED